MSPIIKSLKHIVPVFALMSMAASSSSASAYTLPPPNPAQTANENVAALQRISKGVAAIAKEANEAIVFVSVYKTAQGVPSGMVDPFEFFFGPQGQQGQQGQGRRGGPQAEPPQQRGQQRGQERREGGLGSGFFIDLKKGYILTNNHVVQGADEIQLKLANGESYEGKIVGRDQNTDVAVIQVKKENFDRKGLAELSLGNSDALEVGDFVVALGAPFGLEASLSFGVISAMGRGNLDIAKVGNFIQTDAAINPGNSGGPLIDMHGQVVGVNTAIYSRSGAYNGIGFAVPASLVRPVAEQLINNGFIRRGYLGVLMQPIDDDLRSGLSLPEGVHGGALVAKVVGESPASKAGIEPGDVISEVNNVVMKSNSEVVNAIGLMKPGTTVAMALYRDGKKRSVNVTVGEHPEDQEAKNTQQQKPQIAGKDSPYGLGLAAWSKSLAGRYNIESKGGVIVTGVAPDSPADRGGLNEGDAILKVDGKAISSVDEFQKLAKGKGRILVYIERKGEYYFQRLRKD